MARPSRQSSRYPTPPSPDSPPVPDMNRRRRLFSVLLLALAIVETAGALEWDKLQIAATSARGAEVVRTKFEFKNSAKKPVHILGVTTSCGCTEATPSSSEVKPG